MLKIIILFAARRLIVREAKRERGKVQYQNFNIQVRD